MNRHEVIYARISATLKVKRLVCEFLGCHAALFRTVENFPGGIKPFRRYRCLCGLHVREAYAAVLDRELRSDSTE